MCANSTSYTCNASSTKPTLESLKPLLRTLNAGPRNGPPATLRRVEAAVKARGPFGFDLRQAFWPYWLHELTRHRWLGAESTLSAFMFSV